MLPSVLRTPSGAAGPSNGFTAHGEAEMHKGALLGSQQSQSVSQSVSVSQSRESFAVQLRIHCQVRASHRQLQTAKHCCFFAGASHGSMEVRAGAGGCSSRSERASVWLQYAVEPIESQC